MKTETSQLKGAILGLAVGDALGVPAEFRSRSSMDEKPVKDMNGGGTHGQLAGTWSDDSSLTFCLMESLVSGRIDMNDIATKFLSWLRDAYWTPRGSVFDRGIATTNAILRFDKGMSPGICGGMEEYDNGNGSLMRILPTAFITKTSSVKDRYELVKSISSITHMHFRSVFSCFIYTEYARFLLMEMDKFDAYELLIKEINLFVSKEDFNPLEIKLFERVLSGDIHSLDRDEVSGSGYVLHTLEASFWCFLTTQNYSDATLRAVNLGEDTDTTGAVTGGLAGLYYGIDNIPVNWVNELARKDEIGVLIENFEKCLPNFKKS